MGEGGIPTWHRNPHPPWPKGCMNSIEPRQPQQASPSASPPLLLGNTMENWKLQFPIWKKKVCKLETAVSNFQPPSTRPYITATRGGGLYQMYNHAVAHGKFPCLCGRSAEIGNCSFQFSKKIPKLETAVCNFWHSARMPTT